MANTLTNLIPTIYEAVDTISRELVGFIPAVTLNATADQVAKDQTIRYPVVAAFSATDITPAATGPDPSAVTVGTDTMSISKARGVRFFWEGEEQAQMGALYSTLLRDQFAQAMRTLVNEVETDLAALYKNASRAYGTAGTAPFASTLADPAQMRKILADNGAPCNDLQLVINTSAGAALRTLAQLTKVNEANDSTLLRRGTLLDLHGFAVRESAQVASHTKGTGTGYLLDLTAGYAVGSTTVHVDTGTGTFVAGDIFTNNKTSRDTNKYVVKTGFAGDGDGDVVIGAPGLKIAGVNNDPVGVGNSYSANLAFERSAIHLLARLPKMPEGGDSADDVIVVTDPISNISFQIAMYRQ